MTVDPLSRTFAALADPTRREILSRLAAGGATVGELAEPLPMILPAVSRHLKVLAGAGLITRTREAQWRRNEIQGEPLNLAVDWILARRRAWQARLDRLDAHLRNEGTKR